MPDDDDFLVEWDERSEIEKGNGPKATWHNKHMYDFNQGKVVVSVTIDESGNDVNKQLFSDDIHSFP